MVTSVDEYRIAVPWYFELVVVVLTVKKQTEKHNEYRIDAYGE